MKIAILTYGCSMNSADSALMEKLLKKRGHIIACERDAEVVIVNSCGVKSPTERKIMKKLGLLSSKKRVVVAGCLAQGKPKMIKEKFPLYGILGVEALDNVVGLVEGTEAEDINRRGLNKAALGVVHRSHEISIVEINEGCMSNCSYCFTKRARGNLNSFPVIDIVRNVKHSNTEVWLTSQDTGCYGFDIKTDLPKLLDEISKLGRKTLVRVGMMSPHHAFKISDKLLNSFKSDKIFRFLHAPVQSGSDSVLKHMARGYRAETYVKLVEKFRKNFDRFTFATDVITGYPTESEDDFKKTVELLEITKPDVTNISMFWEREGTRAAELKQLPNRIRKDRSRIVTRLCEDISLENNNNWIGWEGDVFVDEIGKFNTFMARNFAYKPVVLKNARLGEFVNVKIVDAKIHYLVAKRL